MNVREIFKGLILLESFISGFSHTVFTLEHQPEFENLPIDESSIRTGALVSILAKGFQYSEMEANMGSVSDFASLFLSTLGWWFVYQTSAL